VAVAVKEVEVVHADVLGQLEVLLDLRVVPRGRLVGEGDHKVDLRVRVVLRVLLRTQTTERLDIKRDCDSIYSPRINALAKGQTAPHETRGLYLDDAGFPLLGGLRQGFEELLVGLGPHADGQLGDLERMRVGLAPNAVDLVARDLAVLVFRENALSDRGARPLIS
jgi:hypothetical protein